MPLTLLIESELDERSATAAANRAERVYAEASRNIGKQMSSEIGRGAQEAGKAVDQMVDTAQASYRKMLNAQDELAAAERQLKQMREDGARGVEIQAERVRQARKREKEAIREAASAMDDYERSAQRAGEAGEGAGNSVIASLRGAAGRASSAGQELAGGFAEGFAGSAALMRIGAAGGPIGIALAGAAALGVAGGKLLAENIEQGLAELAVRDVIQGRLGADDASMRRYAEAAAGAYTDQWGASTEDNLNAIQLGIHGGLIDRGATEQEAKATVEQMQAVAQTLNADIQEVARSGGQLIRGGMAQNAEQALDILAAGGQRGLNIAGDWMDTVSEYTTQWRKLGLSGSDAIGLINQGLEGAARDSDVVADSLKEFSIRAVDGSKSTAEGFAALGFNADEMRRRFAQGGDTARTAFGAVLQAIKETDDPMQQKLIWASLFGTQFEDMGDAINRFDLSKARNEIGSTDGTVQQLTERLSGNASGWDALGRNVDATFSKLKQWLADSDIGRFIGQGLPGFINNSFFPDAQSDAQQQLADAQRAALRNQLGTGFANAGDAQRAHRGIPNPNVGPTPGARTPIVADADQPGSPGAKQSPQVPYAPGYGRAPLPGESAAMYGAEQNVLEAQHRRATAEAVLAQVMADSTRTANDEIKAQNDVAQAKKAEIDANLRLRETSAKAADSLNKATGQLTDFGAAIDADFGASKGLPGIIENVTKMLGNFALAGPMAQMNALSQANPNQGSGLMGMLASQGAFGPQYTPQAIAAASGQGGYGGAGYGPSQMGPAALQPGGPIGTARPGESAREFAHRVMMPFWQSQGLTVGDHAADKFGEHQNGALDIMVPSIAAGNSVLQQVLSDPNVYGAIFNNQAYGYGQGAAPRPYGGGFTGNPTQDHQDHVHAWYKPGGENNIVPGGPSVGGWQGPGLNPGMYSGGGGQSPVFSNPGGPGIGGAAGQDPFGVAPTTGPGGGGIGITPGGTIDTALNLAAGGVPGLGAAAQTTMKLASRGVQFGGQVAGILADGFLQTFLPQGSQKAGASWLQRGVGALASVKPALPNLAGGKGSPQVGPGMGAQGQQSSQPPVQGGDTNIHVTNNQASEDQNGKTIAFHLGAQNSGPGW